MKILIQRAVVRRPALSESIKYERGFTLIELMVVIIIIGILAAIAIPAFLNQRTAAWDASVKSDLGNLEIAAASFSVTNSGSFTGMTLAKLQATPYSFSSTTGNVAPTIVVSATGTSYTVSDYNTNSTSASPHLWSFDSSTGVTKSN